jgi:hypothetical protein
MTNQQMLAQLITGSLIGICLGLAFVCLKNAVNAFHKIKEIKEKYAALKTATSGSVCPGPHSWDSITLAFKELPVEKYSVCKDCGYIAGTGYQLNGAGLEIFKNDIVRRAKRTEVETEYAKKRCEVYADSGLNAVLAARLEIKIDNLNKEMADVLNKV